MNLDLFRSKHGLIALLLTAACLAWHFVVGEPFGSRTEENVYYLLVTGWLGVALFLALALYAARKAAHRSGLSPEFLAREDKLAQLEQVQSELRSLQNEAAAGALASRGSVKRTAQAVLQRHQMDRVLRIRLEPSDTPPGFALLALPREPLGRLAKWMHVHIYYGLAAAFIVWFHGGGRMGTPMGVLLNVLSAMVILTGVFGIVMWMFGPTWLTRRERELPTEKAFALEEHYRRKVRAQVETLSAEDPPALPGHLAEVLAGGGTPSAEERESLQTLAKDSAPIRDLMVLVSQLREVRREWTQLRRIRRWINTWRLIHVPCSVVLLSLVVVHVISIWTY